MHACDSDSGWVPGGVGEGLSFSEEPEQHSGEQLGMQRKPTKKSSGGIEARPERRLGAETLGGQKN